MIGKWFGKSKKRIGAEEFGRTLAELAQKCEKTVASGWEEIAKGSRPNPLGISLVSAAAVIWATANNRFLGRLPAERFSTLADAYYADIWEGIESRFGAERTQYDEFVWRLGGIIMSDEVKTEWALRTGIHDMLNVAVRQIDQSADEFSAANGSDERATRGIALGNAVARVLLREPSQESAKVAIVAYNAFIAVARATGEFLQELERDDYQVA